MGYKYLEFEDYGPYCLDCGEPANFNGCYLHAGVFPVISDNNRLRLPLCNKCKIECHECGSNLTVNAYSKLYANNKIKNIKPKKLERKDAKDIIVKQEVKDILDQLRSEPHSKNIRYFQNSITNILNEVVFSLEIGSQFAIRDVEEKLENLIPSNMGSIKKYINKLSSLLLLLQLIRTVGLGKYEKEIMDKEITRMFGFLNLKREKPSTPADDQKLTFE